MIDMILFYLGTKNNNLRGKKERKWKVNRWCDHHRPLYKSKGLYFRAAKIGKKNAN